MLTQQDLKAIGMLIDKKVATDIAAIQTRLADLESGSITRIDILSLKSSIMQVEKRMAAVEGRMNKMDGRMDNIKERLDKTLTKDDAKNFATKSDLKKLATKRNLKMMENRLIKSINDAVDALDSKIINHEKRITTLESSRVSLV